MRSRFGKFGRNMTVWLDETCLSFKYTLIQGENTILSFYGEDGAPTMLTIDDNDITDEETIKEINHFANSYLEIENNSDLFGEMFKDEYYPVEANSVSPSGIEEELQRRIKKRAMVK